MLNEKNVTNIMFLLIKNSTKVWHSFSRPHFFIPQPFGRLFAEKNSTKKGFLQQQKIDFNLNQTKILN